MSEAELSFGQRARQTGNGDGLLALEYAEGRTERFEELDRLLGELLRRALAGERLVAFASDRAGNRIEMPALRTLAPALRDEHFALERQQARGAWFVPEEASLKTGRVNYPGYLRRYPLGATDLAQGEAGKVSFAGCPEAVLVWSLLTPLLEPLLIPLDLRARLAGEKPPEEEAALWEEFEQFAAVLGLEFGAELAVLRRGWSRLRMSAQSAVKIQLLDALAAQVSDQTARRYRALRLSLLVKRYYAKADEQGRARMRQVLTKAGQRTLSGFFGGDWLAFLAYLAEQPHPDEEITTALPPARIYGTAGQRVAEVAVAQALPEEEVERILAAYWHDDKARSPLEHRVEVLRRFWHRFDELHASQAPGMPSLWGLIEQERLPFDGGTASVFHPGSYRQHLPAELNNSIAELWGTVLLPRWPERIVSALSAQELMAETFGPALHFWHGCALTAWFLCEGPSSRTDMAGLAAYHRLDLQALEASGCAVAPQLFEELITAEQKLPAPEPIEDARDELTGPPGFKIEVTLSTRSRLKGFEDVRDIITRHRRQWAESCLERYLRTRWEGEVREAARQFNRLTAERAKPPTAKQFAKLAESAVNHWFGGDLAALYGALGEKAPIHPVRVTSMPRNRAAFLAAVYAALGGEPPSTERPVVGHEVVQAWLAAEQRKRHLAMLAQDSLRFLQLEEALGRQPDPTNLGQRRFDSLAQELWDDGDSSWRIYVNAIRKAQNENSVGSAEPANPWVDVEPNPLATPGADQPQRLGQTRWLKRVLGR